MATDAAAFTHYRGALEHELRAKLATEHTHRPALKVLIEQLAEVTATNEPKRVECGAPDYTVWREAGHGPITLGYVEAKDVGTSLGSVETGEQLSRYRLALPNLILTDYLEFRWYVDGMWRRTERLATKDTVGHLTPVRGGERAVSALLHDFLAQEPVEIKRPDELARRMARLTHLVRDLIIEGFSKGVTTSATVDLRAAFSDVLIPHLTVDDFADMYAQTIAYGLFAARANHKGPAPFRRRDAAYEIPRTNPFLRRLFDTITGPDLEDEPYTGLVDDLSQLLAATDMVSVLRHFGERTRLTDPVVHFYETFLAAYDPALRELRGVYYTPEPVVAYIVRSVDELLRSRFGCPGGLADDGTTTYERGDKEVASPRVLVLDPACGSGTFLYYVIDSIRERFRIRHDAGKWSDYVREQLLPRLFGFELLIAPYAIAHLKLGLELAAQDLPEGERADWGYDFKGGERLSVYLTNTLEEGLKRSDMLMGSYISEEANVAAGIKRDLPILVVLGNPPYSGHSANKGEWITNLVHDYTRGVPGLDKPAQAKWLQDDYVKFFRFGHWRIERTGAGVLAFITNHAYLDNPTFRGMRKQLCDTFTDIYVLNLHGNANRKEVTPGGSEDKNVFDIRQGVAIGIFVKEPGREGPAKVHHSDLWGDRENKYEWLEGHTMANTRWTSLSPVDPLYLFVPEDAALRAEYEKGWRLPDIMSVSGDPAPGVVTTHDDFAISWDEADAVGKIDRFLRTDNEAEARSLWRLCRQSQWDYIRARLDLASGAWKEEIVPILYRPFDQRVTVWNVNVAVHLRERVMRQMASGRNVGLITTRSVEIARGFEHVFCTRLVTQHHSVSSKEVDFLFPLYLYAPNDGLALHDGEREANISGDFIAALTNSLPLTWVGDGRGDLSRTVGPEDVFDYIYAVLHCRAYRHRYGDFLRRDFPRVPLTQSIDVFRILAGFGRRLTSLHLLESPLLANSITSYPIPGPNVVEPPYPRYVAPPAPAPGEKPSMAGRVHISKGQYFEGVPVDVWEFHIGGYRVCDRWLRDRQGRRLTLSDLACYEQIITAIRDTIVLMDGIDAAVPSWPLA